MDWLEFISSIVGHIAWPVALSIGVYLLRDQIRELLPSLKRAKLGGAEFDFSEDGVVEKSFDHEPLSDPQEVARMVQYLLDGVHPRNVDMSEKSLPLLILKYWSQVESGLIRWAKEKLTDENVKTLNHALSLAKKNKVFDAKIFAEIERLRILRNKLAHGETMTVDQAEFLQLRDLPQRIRHELDRWEGTN